MKGAEARVRALFSGEGGVFFIAEAGCNYEGDYGRAAEMVRAAAAVCRPLTSARSTASAAPFR